MSKSRLKYLDKQLLSKIPTVISTLTQLQAETSDTVISRKRLRENYFECSDIDLQYLIAIGLLPKAMKSNGYKSFNIQACITLLAQGVAS